MLFLCLSRRSTFMGNCFRLEPVRETKDCTKSDPDPKNYKNYDILSIYEFLVVFVILY
jgi:hypothetical protein